MKKMWLIVFFLLSCVGLGHAQASTKLITLKDGSTVQGKVMGIENGRYVVSTLSMGDIRVQEDDIISIVAPGQMSGQAPVQAVQKVSENDVQAMQNRIMSDPQAMTDIMALVNDPEVAGMLSDPAFLQLIQSRDQNAMAADPNTARLMQNPKIRALAERMQQGQ